MFSSRNFKIVAMATVVDRYPQNLMSSRSSLGKHTLKIWRKSVMDLGYGTPTSFVPAAAAWMARGQL